MRLPMLMSQPVRLCALLAVLQCMWTAPPPGLTTTSLASRATARWAPHDGTACWVLHAGYCPYWSALRCSVLRCAALCCAARHFNGHQLPEIAFSGSMHPSAVPAVLAVPAVRPHA